MADAEVNELFVNFLILLAVDDTFRQEFKAQPEAVMTREGLTPEDKDAIRSAQVPSIRDQIGNIQVSGSGNVADRKVPRTRQTTGKKFDR
jgi:hypothetical protein